MKKALINITVIIVTVLFVGYLVHTGLEVRNNEIESTLSTTQSGYEEADM